MGRSLVLNATYEPLSVVSDRRAVVLVLSDKADVLHESGEAMHSEKLSVPVPSVVRLRSFVRVPFQRRAAISRRGVFLRDDGTCQYCGNRAESIDHVIPRSRGGEHVWENVVAACRRCNTAKRDRYLHETSMQLRRRPDAPRHLSWVSVAVGRVPELWEPYLGDAAIPRVITTPWLGSLPDLGSIELEALELVRVRVPLRAALESAHGVERHRDVVLVRAVGADGAEGWGECSALEAPTYTGEYTAGAWAVLRDHLVPAALAGRFDVVRGHPMATTAVEVALTDLQLRRDGRPLVDALAGEGRFADEQPGVRWTAVVGVQPSLDELLDRVAVARAHGAHAVKLKVHPGWDLDPVAAVRRGHPDLRLAVDANGSFDRLDAGPGAEHLLVRLARMLPATSGSEAPVGSDRGPDHADGVYVEQPNRPGAYEQDAMLLERFDDDEVPAGLALDESLSRAEDVAVVEELLAATALNVKPARLGGLAATTRTRVLIEGATGGRPLRPFIGGLLETGVGRATALAVACSWPAVRDTDLGPSSWYFDDDLTEPIELGVDGRMHTPEGPGIGVAPRPERLAEVVVDRCTIRR